MAPKKTPSESKAPAIKTNKKEIKDATEEKKNKRSKKRVETFAIYIYKVLR